jgi:hypothetical protein
MGPTRSTRLPRPIDEWFNARLALRPEASASEFLVALIHGGLRLREGYMAVHRRQLEDLAAAGRENDFATYIHCLLDTFGPEYVGHLTRWLQADGIVPIPSTTMTNSLR